jgi:hypothetical protein
MSDTNDRDGMGLNVLLLGRTALRAALIGAAVGVVLFANIGPALAGDDDDDGDDLPIDQKIIRNIMEGISGIGKGKDIDYKERSPLVVPPKLDLPKPETSRAELAPNWPKDPDVAERKRKKKAAKEADHTHEEDWHPEAPDPALGAARARTATTPSQPGSVAESNKSDYGEVLSPSKLGFKGFGNFLGGDKPEAAKFDHEPPRESLTDPPVGYQTPSPAYAYGIAPDPNQKNEVPRTIQPEPDQVLKPGKF